MADNSIKVSLYIAQPRQKETIANLTRLVLGPLAYERKALICDAIIAALVHGDLILALRALNIEAEVDTEGNLCAVSYQDYPSYTHEDTFTALARTAADSGPIALNNAVYRVEDGGLVKYNEDQPCREAVLHDDGDIGRTKRSQANPWLERWVLQSEEITNALGQNFAPRYIFCDSAWLAGDCPGCGAASLAHLIMALVLVSDYRTDHNLQGLPTPSHSIALLRTSLRNQHDNVAPLLIASATAGGSWIELVEMAGSRSGLCWLEIYVVDNNLRRCYNLPVGRDRIVGCFTAGNQHRCRG